MALIDTAVGSVKEALGEVTDLASESLDTVGEALGGEARGACGSALRR
jgi:uncharacterized protein YjbJ (UPF0337 family)